MDSLLSPRRTASFWNRARNASSRDTAREIRRLFCKSQKDASRLIDYPVVRLKSDSSIRCESPRTMALRGALNERRSLHEAYTVRSMQGLEDPVPEPLILSVPRRRSMRAISEAVSRDAVPISNAISMGRNNSALKKQLQARFASASSGCLPASCKNENQPAVNMESARGVKKTFTRPPVLQEASDMYRDIHFSVAEAQSELADLLGPNAATSQNPRVAELRMKIDEWMLDLKSLRRIIAESSGTES